MTNGAPRSISLVNLGAMKKVPQHRRHAPASRGGAFGADPESALTSRSARWTRLTRGRARNWRVSGWKRDSGHITNDIDEERFARRHDLYAHCRWRLTLGPCQVETDHHARASADAASYQRGRRETASAWFRPKACRERPVRRLRFH
jgi:hypothetical protein